MRIPASFAVPCLLVGLTLAANSPAARGQLPDYTVDGVDIVQILDSPSYDHIGDRTTILRVSVGATNPGNPANLVDGVVRMFVGGMEHPSSPIMSTNGPFPAEGFSDPLLTLTFLNFICIPPVSDDVVFEIEVNSPGPNFVAETNTNNNTLTTASLDFIARGTMDLAYAPIDYRPGGGGTPNLPNNDLIKPGVGDNFVQGIYPGSRIEYRRIDAPSKLWTSSVSGGGSSLNSSLNADLLLMSPRPDFIYGWIPGSLPYNGQAFINGKAAMGNTESIRHQRTYAHELGHNFGRFHNGETLAVVGIDVEHHLWVTQGLGKIKKLDKFDIMAAGLLTNQAWVANISLAPFYNHFVFNSSELVADTPGPQVMVSGVWNRETGAVTLDPMVEIPNCAPVRAAEAGMRDLVLRGFVGDRLVRELPISVQSSLDECPGCLPAAGPVKDAHESREAEDDDPRADELGGRDSNAVFELEPEIPFVTLLPARSLQGEPIDTLEVAAAGSRPVITQRRRGSTHAPQVQWLSPTRGEALGSSTELRWAANDQDGDALFTTVRYAPDGGTRRVPLGVHLTGDRLSVDLSGLPHFRSGAGFFELLVSDGFHTTVARSDPLEGPGAFLGAGGNLPFVEIYHPDDGRSFARGMKVVLHSSGWDLEDLALDGSSIQWSSDVDGPLGSGRRFTVDTLSVGTHQITVTATDSGAQQTQRTHEITITDRGLPYAFDPICAADLGSGGPGNAVLSLCGGDLTAGDSADLQLVGAAPNAAAFLFMGITNGPTPLKGGVLVPVPWLAILNLVTDGAGEIYAPGITSPGPITLFWQIVIADGGQVLGYDFSNAIQVEF